MTFTKRFCSTAWGLTLVVLAFSSPVSFAEGFSLTPDAEVGMFEDRRGPRPYAPRRNAISQPAASGVKVGPDVLMRDTDVVYRSTFDKGNQFGDIVVNTLLVGRNSQSEVTSTLKTVLPQWISPNGYITALSSAMGDESNPGWKRRHIFSWDPYKETNDKSIRFDYDEMSSELRNTLGASKDTVNYIRGDRSNERPAGDKLRRRTGLLGEIVHSNLIYWEHHSALKPGQSSDQVKKRLYVGSNDGMLHAFDAETGREVWAYVPSCLYPKLRFYGAGFLTEARDELALTTAYVDGQINVKEVQNFGPNGETKTILVGSLGAGARCVYALDITEPGVDPGSPLPEEWVPPTEEQEKFHEGRVLWEITSSTDGFSDLGHVYGGVEIARVQYDWVGPSNRNSVAIALFGNGYQWGGNKRLAVYAVNLKTGDLIKSIDEGDGLRTQSGVWHVGMTRPTAVYPMKPSAGSPGDAEPGRIDEYNRNANEASENRGYNILDAQRVHTHAYVGSYQGELYKIDLQELQDSGRVGIRHMYTALRSDGKVFSESRESLGISIRRSISTGVKVHPIANNKRVILFGTGRKLSSRLHVIQGLQSNAIYGIFDEHPDDMIGGRIDSTDLDYRKVFEAASTSPTAGELVRALLVGDYMGSKTPLHLLGKSRTDAKGNPNSGGWALTLNNGQAVIAHSPSIRKGQFHVVSHKIGSEGAYAKNWYYVLSLTRGARLDCPVFDLDGDGQLLCRPKGAFDGDVDLGDYLFGARAVEKLADKRRSDAEDEGLFADLVDRQREMRLFFLNLAFGEAVPVAQRLRTGDLSAPARMVSQPTFILPIAENQTASDELMVPLFNIHRGFSHGAWNIFVNSDPESWQIGDVFRDMMSHGVRYKVELNKEPQFEGSENSGDESLSQLVVERQYFFPVRGKWLGVDRIYFDKDGQISSRFVKRPSAAVLGTFVNVVKGLINFGVDLVEQFAADVEECKKRHPRPKWGLPPLKKRAECRQNLRKEREKEGENVQLHIDQVGRWRDNSECFSHCIQKNRGGSSRYDRRESNLYNQFYYIDGSFNQSPGGDPTPKRVKPVSIINLEERS